MSLSCPVCKSTDVECQKRPHMHRCNTCGYDGTTTAVCTCDGCGVQKWAPMHPDVPNLCAACQVAKGLTAAARIERRTR